MLALGVLILTLIVGTSLWLVRENSVYSDEVAQIRQVRSAAADLLSTLQDAETGQRGFLLTLDRKYLDPYNAAIESLSERRQRLREATNDALRYSGSMHMILWLVLGLAFGALAEKRLGAKSGLRPAYR